MAKKAKSIFVEISLHELQAEAVVNEYIKQLCEREVDMGCPKKVYPWIEDRKADVVRCAASAVSLFGIEDLVKQYVAQAVLVEDEKYMKARLEERG